MAYYSSSTSYNRDGDQGAGNDEFAFNVSRDGAVSRNLGDGDDTVKVSADSSVTQVRLTFTSVEVGNGNANDSNTMRNQDGGLAVRLQAENGADGLVGPISRFDDEGITFEANSNFTFDVRDLVQGTQRGDQFDVVRLGTLGNDTFNEGWSGKNYYINAGMGNDNITGGGGNDFLVGGAGNDRINGGRDGLDSLLGGGGADTFVFDDSSSSYWGGGSDIDRILDFTSGTDKIDLKAFGIAFGNVKVAPGGTTGTNVFVDTDRDGDFDLQFTLVNGAVPTQNDFLF